MTQAAEQPIPEPRTQPENQPQQGDTIAANIELNNQFQSGANWFYWIAALSIVNSTIALLQGEWAFIVGLGVTQVFDGLALAIAAEASELAVMAKGFAFVADLVVAGIFVVFGVLARKQLHWAFIVGMVLYALDGLLFLLFSDFLSLGFHAFALWGLYRGLVASGRLKAQTAHGARFRQPEGVGGHP